MTALSKFTHRAVALLKAPLRMPLRCSGCGQERDGVRRLISGATAYLCDSCIEQAAQRLTPRRPAVDAVRCRFCSLFRAKEDVTSVGNVVVCADCLGCMEVILAEAETSPRET